MKKRTSRWATMGLVMSIGLVPWLGLTGNSAYGVSVLSISGVVTIPTGTPVAGASVTDGAGHSTTTDVNGDYSFQETGTGTYRIAVIKSGLTPQETSVVLSLTAPNATANFVLKYLSSASVNQTYVSTASSSATLTLTMTTTSPNPGTAGNVGESCASVTDSRTSTTSPMTLQSTASGSATWAWSEALAQDTTEGRDTLTTAVSDCASGTQIDTGTSTPYVVDNTPPTVIELLPLDGGNTVFTSQPLIAIASDSLSRIDPSSYAFTLDDVTAGTSTSFSGSAVSVQNGVAQTAPVPLVQGDLYKASVSVADEAGNVANFDQATGFDIDSETPAASTTASIPTTSCTLSGGGGLSTTQTATCTSVPVDLGATSTALSGAMTTPAKGYVDETVSLSNARVSGDLDGVNVSEPAYLTSAPTVTEPMLFSVNGPVTSGAPIAVPATADNIGTLTFQIPSSWTSASISMPTTSTSANIATCANPATAVPAFSCEPDPLQFGYAVLLNGGEVSNVQSEADAEAAEFNSANVGADQSQSTYQAFVAPTELPSLLADPVVVSATPEVPSRAASTSSTPLIPSTSDPCTATNSGSSSVYYEADDPAINWGYHDWNGATSCDESMWQITATSAASTPPPSATNGGSIGECGNINSTVCSANTAYQTDGSLSCLDNCFGTWGVVFQFTLDFPLTDATGAELLVSDWNTQSNWTYAGEQGYMACTDQDVYDASCKWSTSFTLVP